MTKKNPLRPSENTSWISALDAVHLISPKVGGDKKAKKIILGRLNDGAIQTTAWWFAEGYDVGAPYVGKPIRIEHVNGKPKEFSKDEWHDLIVEASKPTISETRMGTNFATRVSSGDIILGRAFWLSATLEDQAQWDWGLGLFKSSFPNAATVLRSGSDVRAKVPSRMRMYALGVHFLRDHIEKIVGLEARTLPAPPAAPSRAGRKLTENWANWVPELVWLYHHGGIGIDETTNGLIEKIEKIAAEQGLEIPAKNTVWKTADQVLNVLKSRLDAEAKELADKGAARKARGHIPDA